jgi:hypothetical protein
MWYYNNEVLNDIPKGCIGFVYLVTNTASGKMYIGKKNFFFSKTKVLKGKKKKFKVESDWKIYYGSSDDIKADVESLGTQFFKREILYLCANKSQMSYYELREQIDRRVLESDQYYNLWISAKVRKTKQLTIPSV